MITYYKITGLNEGQPIEPIVIKINPLDYKDQRILDNLLYVGNNDACRYYEEITKQEYIKIKREQNKREKEELINFLREDLKLTEEKINAYLNKKAKRRTKWKITLKD